MVAECTSPLESTSEIAQSLKEDSQLRSTFGHSKKGKINKTGEGECARILKNAVKFAKSFRQESEKWLIISRMWVEMLSYGAAQCQMIHHCQQLRRGGELLTHVWLFMAHRSLTEESLSPNYAKTIKMDTVGRCKPTEGFRGKGGSRGKGSYGGLIRSEQGEWICGFMGSKAYCSKEEAELEAILEGLKMIDERHLHDVVLQCDSEIGQQILFVEESLQPDLQVEVKYECLYLIRKCRVNVQDEPTTDDIGIQCAQILASLGAEMENEKVERLENPPPQIVHLLQEHKPTATATAAESQWKTTSDHDSGISNWTEISPIRHSFV